MSRREIENGQMLRSGDSRLLGTLLHNELACRSRRRESRSCCPQRLVITNSGSNVQLTDLVGSGVRINCISPGQIDVGVDLQGVRRYSRTTSDSNIRYSLI